MKHAFNFSSRPFRNYKLYVVVFRVIFIALAAISLLHCLFLYQISTWRKDTYTEIRDLNAEKQKLVELAKNLEKSLDKQKIQMLNAKTQKVNALIEKRRFSWLSLLKDLENVLPPSVFVRSVMPSFAKDGKINLRLATISKSPKDLVDLLDRLEASPIFERAYPANEREDVLAGIGGAIVSDVSVVYLHDAVRAHRQADVLAESDAEEAAVYDTEGESDVPE